MINRENYDKVFMDSFELDKSKLNDELEYNSIEAWDSIGHMQMIAELEDVFEIEFENGNGLEQPITNFFNPTSIPFIKYDNQN